MSCGCVLKHFSSKCGPKTCATPQGPTKRIYDTCASCHPSHNIKVITDKYDELRDTFTEKIAAARSREELEELEKALREQNVQRAKELRIARNVSWDGNVDWGVGEGERSFKFGRVLSLDDVV